MVKNKITQNQYIFIIFSAMIGIGVLTMAADLCTNTKQNGWMPIIVGALYPLFIVITASIIDDKTNHAGFWEYSTEIYGKPLTYIFAIIFLFYFITLFAAVISGYTNVLNLSIAPFIKPIYIFLPCIILISIISLGGIHIVGRVCEFYFYITIPLLLITLFLIPEGSITNIQPVYFSFKEISKSIPATFFAFSGCEISYFIINKISNNKNTKKAGIIAILILFLIYIINVFIVIYNLGWELTSKLEYPLLYLIQSIEIRIISNFLSIVIFLWSAIILKNLLVYDFVSSEILSKITTLDYKKVKFIILPIIFIYTFFMIPEYNRKTLIETITPLFVIFSFIWALTTTILVSIKYKGSNK